MHPIESVMGRISNCKPFNPGRRRWRQCPVEQILQRLRWRLLLWAKRGTWRSEAGATEGTATQGRPARSRTRQGKRGPRDIRLSKMQRRSTEKHPLGRSPVTSAYILLTTLNIVIIHTCIDRSMSSSTIQTRTTPRTSPYQTRKRMDTSI